ncbi:CHAD domain-containing protein [Nocardioides panacis]|uniref:CHAD domain-containing protein n=1 Tax=Nocardioides panacis TaxID=2849501 RepID=A0A975Y214_9ACTN|nr:CHAD domain-containing protein [Nocardioides panacis]
MRELRGTAAAVSESRDAESVRSRIDALLQDEGPDRDGSRTRTRVAVHLQDHYRASMHASLAYLDSPEYDAFVRRMERFTDLPPWTDAADHRADEEQTVLVEHEDCLLTQRVLFEAGEQAFLDGGDEPLLWRLQGREASTPAALRAEIARRATTVGRPSHHRWLR